MRTDITNTMQTSGSLGYGDEMPIVGQRGGSAYTALPALGKVIVRGQRLYAVDGAPSTLLYGDVPAYRDLVQGMSGDDVGELKTNLAALGFSAGAWVADDRFDALTADAVSRWQASRGLGPSRVVRVGDAIYAAGPVRIAALSVSTGQAGQAGAGVMTVTSPDVVVQARLPVAQQYRVRVGDAVTVTMPDGQTVVPGTVSAMSATAVAGNQGSQDGGTAPPGDGNSGSGATVLMTVGVPNLPPDQHFDRAPVSVNVVSAHVSGVLAVPINALQALAGGGYAVTVVDGATKRLVGVQTGLFSDSRVQVSGAGLAAGQLVEVPVS